MIPLRLRSREFEVESLAIEWLLLHHLAPSKPRLESVDRLTSTESPDIKAVQTGEPGMRAWHASLAIHTSTANR